MLGRVLGGRYSLGERLGGGGTAYVYKGRDSLLNRTVAVKVLNMGLTHDNEFISKFKREAQAAASLTNPHIVGIYDVGQDGDLYYIVMEYVEGKTLKQYITEKGPLSRAQIIDITLQIAEALQHAHRHGVIHRDIKPHNILLTRDGQAKVTDFGIARAATTSTLTQSDSLMGSVHYMSPEQARGGFTNEKSDIYSLGVVMYEMITGEVPFTGDSMFAIAMKHLQEKPRPIHDLAPYVDPALARIVTKAMSKDQAGRYKTAEEMLAELASLSILAEPRIEKGPPPRRTKERNGENTLEDTYVPAQGDGMGRRSDMAKQQKKKPSWMAILAGLMTVIMVGTGVFLVYSFWPRPEVTVPPVVGRTLSEAERILRDAGLVPTIGEGEFSSDVPANVVLRQHPDPGRVVRSGRMVEIIPSRGADLNEVPNVAGLSVLQADITLRSLGFMLGQQFTEHSNTVAEGLIIAQNPRPPVRVERGTPVDITVSLGPAIVEVNVPNLSGLTERDAELRLQSFGLVRGSVTREYSVMPYGTVIRQSPGPEERVEQGTAISIVVSGGQLVRRTVRISADRLTNNSRVEVHVEDREGRKMFLDRFVDRDEGDVLVPVEGISPMRVVVRIDGRIDLDEVIE